MCVTNIYHQSFNVKHLLTQVTDTNLKSRNGPSLLLWELPQTSRNFYNPELINLPLWPLTAQTL